MFDLTVDPDGEVCPGTGVTFTCSVPTFALRWEYNGSKRSLSTVGEEATIGPFMVDVIEANATFISSTATVTATGELNGAVITCVNPMTLESLNDKVSVTSKL